jgi:hypothetical protein
MTKATTEPNSSRYVHYLHAQISKRDCPAGPMVREAQRHLAGWTLQPIAELLAEEAKAKLGVDVMIDVGRPLQAFDAGGRARALSQIIEAMGRAKELGLSPAEMQSALLSVNFGGGDGLA